MTSGVSVRVRRDRGQLTVASVSIDGVDVSRHALAAELDIRADSVGRVNLTLVVSDVVVVDEARPIPPPPEPTAKPGRWRH